MYVLEKSVRSSLYKCNIAPSGSLKSLKLTLKLTASGDQIATCQILPRLLSNSIHSPSFSRSKTSGLEIPYRQGKLLSKSLISSSAIISSKYSGGSSMGVIALLRLYCKLIGSILFSSCAKDKTDINKEIKRMFLFKIYV